jgi:hypothetical protein
MQTIAYAESYSSVNSLRVNQARKYLRAWRYSGPIRAKAAGPPPEPTAFVGTILLVLFTPYDGCRPSSFDLKQAIRSGHTEVPGV